MKGRRVAFGRSNELDGGGALLHCAGGQLFSSSGQPDKGKSDRMSPRVTTMQGKVWEAGGGKGVLGVRLVGLEA